MSKSNDLLKQLSQQYALLLLRLWFPNGRQEGRYYLMGNIRGDAGDSLKINLDTGQWFDFANPEDKGINLISLCMAIFGLDFASACRKVQADLKALGIKHADLDKKSISEPAEIAIFPVPEDAGTPELTIGRPHHSKPGFTLQNYWVYVDETGKLLFYVLRFQSSEKKASGKFDKIIIPCCYFGKEKGWQYKGSGHAKNPLYRAHVVSKENAKKVLLVEGEKAADAGATLFLDYVATCWPGGTGQIHKADFNTLKDRNVIYWPDADEPGKKSVSILIEMLRAAGVASLKIVQPPASFPKGWDIADPPPNDANLEDLLDQAIEIDLNATIPLLQSSFHELAKRLIYNGKTREFIDRLSGRQFEAVSLDAMFMHKAEGKTRASTFLLSGEVMQKVFGYTYRPGAVDLVIKDALGDAFFNLWRPSGLEPIAGDASILVNHLRYLCPTDEEFELLADCLAFMVQYPGQKLKFSPVIIGKQGTGKSALATLMSTILGAHNTAHVTTGEMRSDFNGWIAEKQLVIVEEIMAEGRIAIMNVLKPLITEGTITINRKYIPSYKIENVANFIFLSNYRNALRLEADDRRYFVIASERDKQPQDYYKALFGWIKTSPGVALHWLQSRDLSNFDPDKPPPITAGKAKMIQYSANKQKVLIETLIGEKEPPFECDLITIKEAFAALTGPIGAARGMALNMVDLGHILEDLGAIRLGQKNGTINGKLERPSLWIIRDFERYASMSAQKLVETYFSSQYGQTLPKTNSPF